jgi:hypothetical protein
MGVSGGSDGPDAGQGRRPGTPARARGRGTVIVSRRAGRPFSDLAVALGCTGPAVGPRVVGRCACRMGFLSLMRTCSCAPAHAHLLAHDSRILALAGACWPARWNIRPAGAGSGFHRAGRMCWRQCGDAVPEWRT